MLPTRKTKTGICKGCGNNMLLLLNGTHCGYCGDCVYCGEFAHLNRDGLCPKDLMVYNGPPKYNEALDADTPQKKGGFTPRTQKSIFDG